MLMVLEVGVVVCAIAGVTIVAAMAIAPERYDLMFRLRVAHERNLTMHALVSTANEIRREMLMALS